MKVEHSVTIGCSVDEVFSLLGNPDNDSTWGSLIVESKLLSPGSIGVGSRFEQTATFMGARMSAVIEITEYEPQRILRYETSRPIAIEHSRTFQEVPGGTRLTFVTEINAQGKFRVAEVLLHRAARRQMEADMDEIKALMEGAQCTGHQPA